jgi:hypothetical protein
MQLYSLLLLPIQFSLSGAILFLLLSSYVQGRRIHRAGLLTKGDWLAVAGLFALASLLRLTLVPQMFVHTNFHALYFVENALGPRTTDAIDLLGRTPYGLTNYSLFQLCWAYLPRTWPVYLNINAVISAATIPLVFLLIRLLDGSRWWALGGAILMTLLPAHMKMGPTESEITLSSFFALLSLVLWTAYLRAPDKILLAGTFAALLVTVHSRVLPTAFPAALVVIYFALPLARRLPVPGKHLAVGGGIWAALAWPQYVYVVSLLVHSDAGDGKARFAGQLTRVLSPETSLLLNSEVTPFIVPLFVAVGSGLLIWRRKRQGAILVAATALVAQFYHIHSSHVLDQLRYQFFLWPFLAILAGFALEELCVRLPNQTSRAVAMASWGTALALWLIPANTFLQSLPPSSHEATFVLENTHHLPATAILLGCQPLTAADGRHIAPLFIPSFILDDSQLQISHMSTDEVPANCGGTGIPVLAYVGLQNHVVYSNEELPKGKLPRLSSELRELGCSLEPVLTKVIQTSGPTPGPELEFLADEVEIGFYRLRP